MEVEELGEENGILEVKLSGANEAVANSLRRAMVSGVHTLAPTELQISKNGSGLFDEIIANRTGQVPFTIPDNVDPEDEVHLAVNQEGPTTVTAEDIQTDNEEAEPVHDAIIVELKDGQELEFEGTAELDTGEEHARHQGGTVGYEKTGEGEFRFRIESTSGYDNRELYQEAVEVLQESLEEFEEGLEAVQ